jgi:hypothetical protein
MEIKLGWAVDYGKTRFDVTVTETDLLRLLAERGAEDPAAVSASMVLGHVYLAMYAEAQAFVRHSQSRQEPGQREEHLKAYREHLAERDRVLSRYVPLPEPVPAPETAEAIPF